MFQFGTEIQLERSGKGSIAKILEDMKAVTQGEHSATFQAALAALSEKPRSIAWQRLAGNVH